MFKNLLLASALAVPAVSMADGLSYSYAEGSYQSINFDKTDNDFDGFNVGGSYLFGSTFFAAADYSTLSGDQAGDLDLVNIGGGARYALTKTIDAVASLDFVSAKIKGGDDDTGFRVKGGVRALASDALELNAALAYRDLFDDSQTILSVGGVYSVTPHVALVVGTELEKDYTAFSLGGRYNF